MSNVLNEYKIEKFIRNSVNSLLDGSVTNCRYILDDRLAIFVGWSDFGDEWYIVSGIKVHTSDSHWTDYDYLNFPYYDNGELIDIEEVIGTTNNIDPDFNYIETARYFSIAYNDILKKLDINKDGMIIE